MKRWFAARTPISTASSSLTAAEEPHALAEAMASAMLMMNDEIDIAEEQLRKGTSPFHKLGRAYALFFRAILGFEKNIMEQASLRLAEAEESAIEHQRRAIRDPSSAHRSAIYPSGAEYALCHAEAQLMSAVVAVLNESLTESLKGFYKLRKAFWTLHEISEAEKKYLSIHHSTPSGSATSAISSPTTMSNTVTQKSVRASTSANLPGTHTPAKDEGDDDDDDEFVDASEEVVHLRTKAGGLQDWPQPSDHDSNGLSLHDVETVSPGHEDPPMSAPTNTEEEELDFRTVTSDPIDLYIHSGTGMMYEECAKGFVKCVELNSWSHGLYYYIAGACYVELYRTYRGSNPEKAAEYAEKANLLMHKVPEHMGKKRLMARQLPLDTFVLRKITKWDHRARQWKCDFVDAVGVSPTEEMNYFWSGYRRMNSAQLQDSLKRFAWSDDPTTNEQVSRESADEKAIVALLKATCLRFLGEIASAQSMLQENVFSHQLQQLKACDHPDTWPLPVAHYEMAVCLWEEAGKENGDRILLRQCSEEVAKIEKWESFDLEARVGMKVTTARETLRKLGV